MTLPQLPPDSDISDVEDVVAEPPTLLDLEAGAVRITPVRTPEDGLQYSVEFPDGPLSPDDAEHLGFGLHPIQSGGTVLVGIDEYTETERQTGVARTSRGDRP